MAHISPSQYRSLLKYLYFEGYVDTYQDAEELLESLSDDEFDVLCERTFHGKQPGRAIQITGPRRSGSDTSSSEPDLDAMRSRFKEADEEEAAARQSSREPKGPTTVPSRGVPESEPALRRRTPEGHRKRGASPRSVAFRRAKTLSTGTDPVTGERRTLTPSPEEKQRAKDIRKALKKSKKWGTPEAAKEEYILNYLMTEGYADSYEQAEEILIHMSDLWEETILNEAAKDQSDKQIDKGVKTTYKAGNVLVNRTSPALNRLSPSQRDAKIKRMRARLEARRKDLFGERNRREDEKTAAIKKLLGL